MDITFPTDILPHDFAHVTSKRGQLSKLEIGMHVGDPNVGMYCDMLTSQSAVEFMTILVLSDGDDTEFDPDSFLSAIGMHHRMKTLKLVTDDANFSGDWQLPVTVTDTFQVFKNLSVNGTEQD